MFSWNEENIKWFSKAAKESDFHKNLKGCIKKYFTKEDTILSLGCGLGFLENELSENVKSLTLVDNNKSAINYVVENKKENINVILDDWNNVEIKCDYLLLSFFSRLYLEENINDYLKLCNKSIIYIINEKRSNLDKVIKYLDKQNLKYNIERYTFNFNQRLKKEEISKYLKCYYSSYNQQQIEKLKKNIIKKDGQYLFLNNKKIAIFKIDK